MQRNDTHDALYSVHAPCAAGHPALEEFDKIVNKVDCDRLHQALSALYAWAADWQLGISIDKCCVMCIGKGTDQFHTVAFNLLFCLHVAIWVLQSEMTFHLVIILLI